MPLLHQAQTSLKNLKLFNLFKQFCIMSKSITLNSIKLAGKSQYGSFTSKLVSKINCYLILLKFLVENILFMLNSKVTTKFLDTFAPLSIIKFLQQLKVTILKYYDIILARRALEKLEKILVYRKDKNYETILPVHLSNFFKKYV